MIRIVVNGLSNALKFCPAGPIDVKLVMHPMDSKHFQLCITDDGPGIDPTLIPRLLEPFTKRDVHTPGIGLGLHITKTLVQNLKGQLDITSDGMRGTQFTVTLPWGHGKDSNGTATPEYQDSDSLTSEVIRAACQSTVPSQPVGIRLPRLASSDSSASGQSSEAHLQTPPDVLPDPLSLSCQDAATVFPEPVGPAVPSFDPLHPDLISAGMQSSESLCATEPMRVMIIDDNDVCRRLLAALVMKMIRNAGKSNSDSVKPVIQQYSDGQSAVYAYHSFRPHLVLTDVSMPGMDGVTAAQHMRMIDRQGISGLAGCPADDSAGVESDAAAVGVTRRSAWGCLIYAITGLGSSDPRLRASGLLGGAALDGWLVKGKDDMPRVEEIVRNLAARLRNGG